MKQLTNYKQYIWHRTNRKSSRKDHRHNDRGLILPTELEHQFNVQAFTKLIIE